MRDVDDRYSPRAQIRDDSEEPADIILIEAARRFVEYDCSRTRPDRAGDLHELLLGNGECRHHSIRIDASTDRGEQLDGSAAERFAIDKAETPRQRTEAKILADAQVVAERELLVDDRDSRGERVTRARESGWPAVNDNRTFIGLMNAGENLPERAFSGAILSADGVARAGGNLKAHTGECRDARKTFGYSAEFYGRQKQIPRFARDDNGYLIATNFGSTSVKPQSFN
jgi:hypothetical protein